MTAKKKATKKNSKLSKPKKSHALKYKPDQIIAALKQTKGKTYLASKALGCDFKTIQNYAKRFPEIQEVIEEERGHSLDIAESALERAVLNGEGWAVCFTLKTIGKKRGYVERQEITGADGENLFKIIKGVDEDDV